MANMGLSGVILLGTFVAVPILLIVWLLKPSKRKLDEAADQKRIADALEEIAKSKKEND